MYVIYIACAAHLLYCTVLPVYRSGGEGAHIQRDESQESHPCIRMFHHNRYQRHRKYHITHEGNKESSRVEII